MVGLPRVWQDTLRARTAMPFLLAPVTLISNYSYLKPQELHFTQAKKLKSGY